jgi:hypothetical protein
MVEASLDQDAEPGEDGAMTITLITGANKGLAGRRPGA